MNSALARIQLQQMLDKLDRLTRTPRVTEEALDVAKLKEHGITVSRYRQSVPELARLVQTVEPCLGGHPENILRAWIGADPEPAQPSRMLTTGRPYRMSPALRAAAERARVQPRMLAMVSRVPIGRDYGEVA